MPVLEITMLPEEGMNIRELKEALIKKVVFEKIRVGGLARGRAVRWDARPNFSKLSPEGITLRWRYKQFKRT